MGIFGLVMITAPAIGPTLSGYIVEYYDWRLLFEMILPLAIISLLLGIWKSENVMRQNKMQNLIISHYYYLLSALAVCYMVLVLQAQMGGRIKLS